MAWKTEKVIVNADTMDSIKWPTCCPSCGGSTSERATQKLEVKVAKGIKALFAGSTPEKIQVAFCSDCARKISNAKTLETTGFVVGGIAFPLWAFILKPKSEPEFALVFLASFFGAIFGWYGESRGRKLLATRIKRLSKRAWGFSFSQKTFAEEFAELNSAAIK